ncbi:MAG: nuclease-related domain-containing protein [Sarcina sp.]
MRIVEAFKKLFKKDKLSKQKNKVTQINIEKECEIEDNVAEIIQKKKNTYSNIAENLSYMRRTKYKESSMSLANRLECEMLEYLLAREKLDFAVYWNLYVPYSNDDYMQIDNIIITGDTIYVIECKDYRTCIGIDEIRESWKCHYPNKKVYKNMNASSQNKKHISVLKKYLGIDNYEFKSIVALIVSDDFKGYLAEDDIYLVRDRERNILFKLLDKKIKDSDKEIDDCFVKINSRVYECMNPSNDIIEKHKNKIKARYS